MAGATLLALIDDIATLLDDVSILSKIAVKKTAGVLGDDLALNAQQLTGVNPNRELPVVWAVAKGSLVNKVILVPAALLISAWAPWAITPLLMIGGAYLCYEGCEKLLHKWLHYDKEQEHVERVAATVNPAIDMVAFEKDKIRGAVRTDFVLSAEIIVIALGTVRDVDFSMRVAVLVSIALIMTVGVYGLVAAIIKLDDLGLALSTRTGRVLGRRLQRAIGRTILWLAPYLMKTLSIVGTAAMFMVGGGILTHGIAPVEHLIHDWSENVHGVAGVGWLLASALTLLLDALFGALVGAAVVAVVFVVSKLVGRKHAEPH